MMRIKTKEKYEAALSKLIDEDSVINYQNLTTISRERFGNFVTMHHLRDIGCLIDIGNKNYRWNKSISVPKMILMFDNYQQQAGKAAMEKFRAKNNITKAEISKPELNFKSDIKSISDSDLVQELRLRGYDVICKKITTLEL